MERVLEPEVNSLLHHLPEPAPFWEEVARIGRRGAPVLVMDLLRPSSAEAATEIVDIYARDEPAVLRHDFHQSLLAAFTLDEVLAELRRAALSSFRAEVVDDRHWLVSGRLP